RASPASPAARTGRRRRLPELDDGCFPRSQRESTVHELALAVAARPEAHGAAARFRLDRAVAEVQRDNGARAAPEGPRAGRPVEQLVATATHVLGGSAQRDEVACERERGRRIV